MQIVEAYLNTDSDEHILKQVMRTINENTKGSEKLELIYEFDDYFNIYREIRKQIAKTDIRCPIVPANGKESVYYSGVIISLKD